jgi:acyl-CoA thioester hydrolase
MLHTQPVRIYFEDTDAGGIVYHASWLRFFERARTDWLRSLGITQSRLQTDAGLGFVVRRLMIDYLRPAKLDDEVLVDVRLLALGRASLTLAQSATLMPRGTVLVTAQVQVAAIRTDSGKPAALPAPLLTQLAQLRDGGTDRVQSSSAAY